MVKLSFLSFYEIDKVISSDYLLYADDLQIFRHINIKKDHLLMQKDIDAVSD